jgi:hypothetical protein
MLRGDWQAQITTFVAHVSRSAASAYDTTEAIKYPPKFIRNGGEIMGFGFGRDNDSGCIWIILIIIVLLCCCCNDDKC